ncbi:MAG: trigger factor [Phycisphaeraceae bacterium]|nr:trigger factor [Phycisphaeraceae bacterium]
MADETNNVTTEDDVTPETPEAPETATATEEPEAEESALQQTVSVKDSGPACKELTIEVSEESIANRIEESYDQLATDATIPGFRRGYAPRKLIERRFGSSVKDDVRARLISESYSKAIEDEGLDVIGEPDVKNFDEIELPETGTLSYVVEVEVSPAVDVPAFDTFEVEEEAFEVTDEDVAKEIDSMADRYGDMASIGDGEVQEKDFVQAHVNIYAGKDAGDDAEEIGHHHGVYILVNGEKADYKGHVAGIVVEELGKKLAGKKVTDEVRVSMTGPESHEDDKIKGQDITIVIKIEDIQRVKPVDMDKLTTMLGVESEDDLKTRIKEDLQQRREREQQSKKHDQLREQLLEKIDFELPEKIAGRQIARNLQNQAMQFAYQGMKEDEIEAKLADIRSENEEQARKDLRLFFILDRIAKDNEIEVTPEEINGRIYMMAMMRQTRPEKLRQQMQQSGEIESLYMNIREQKTLDKILEGAKVKTK